MQVVVELVGGICNSHCVWCFTSYKYSSKLKRGMMSFEQFAHFIALNEANPFAIIPFGHGEALLNPDFVLCCKHARQEGFTLGHLHTNFAMRLTDVQLDFLKTFGSITVNVGGGASATHFLNMGTSFEQVLANIKALWCRGKAVDVKMVLNKRNKDEVELLKKTMSEISPAIGVSTFPVYFGPADSDDEDRRLFFEHNLSTVDGRVDESVQCRDNVTVEGNGRVVVVSRSDKCYGLITTVRWDGAVSICCRSRYHESPVGDAFATSIRDIRASKTYKEATVLGAKRQWIEYCKYCS